ncbi:MAG: phosphoribosylglycinamide formyltransferase [Actinobacteria bacterium]|nr:phosphoribosylglycinamide formyltransferase [Actinomycetota bacterium]
MGGRIVVLISGNGSNMAALDSACRAGEVPGAVEGVFADRPCNGLKIAAERGISTMVLEPKDYLSRDEWSSALRDAALRYSPDLVVSAGFMRILSPVFVDEFADRLINLHPALLPDFPGAHAVRDALAAGVDATGSTVHFVDHLVDHGPVILQEKVNVHPGDDEDSLHGRIKEAEHRILPEACRLVLAGRVRLEGGRVLVDPSI